MPDEPEEYQSLIDSIGEFDFEGTTIGAEQERDEDYKKYKRREREKGVFHCDIPGTCQWQNMKRMAQHFSRKPK